MIFVPYLYMRKIKNEICINVSSTDTNGQNIMQIFCIQTPPPPSLWQENLWTTSSSSIEETSFLLNCFRYNSIFLDAFCDKFVNQLYTKLLL